MPLGTALSKECRWGIQRLRTALRRLIISFTPSFICSIIFSFQITAESIKQIYIFTAKIEWSEVGGNSFILAWWGNFGWPRDPWQPAILSLPLLNRTQGDNKMEEMEKMEKDWVEIRTEIILISCNQWKTVNIGKINLICGQLKIKENVEKQKQNQNLPVSFLHPPSCKAQLHSLFPNSSPFSTISSAWDEE